MGDRFFKIFRMLGLFLILALGFNSIVGCAIFDDDDDNTTTTTTLPQATTTTTTLPPATTTTTKLPPSTTTTTTSTTTPSTTTTTTITVPISGQLDPTFNDDGIAVDSEAAGGGAFSEDDGRSLTLDSSGNVYVTGFSYNSSLNTDMVIWKYLPNGTLDNAFGTNGIVVYDGGGYDQGNDIELDSSGNIFVAGWTGTAPNDIAIWKYLPNGTPDNTFGTNGVAIYDGGVGTDHAWGLFIDSSDNIYVTGYSRINPELNTFFTSLVILKYDNTGSLDNSFSDDGIVASNDGLSPVNMTDERGFDIVLDPSGNILVTGIREISQGNSDMIIRKYTSQGVLDNTFGTNGFVIDSGTATNGTVDEIEEGLSITLDQSGNIYVAGRSESSSGVTDFNMVGWKYTSAGVLEGTIIHDGAAGGVNDAKNDSGTSIALDASGNIYIAGYSQTIQGDYDMVIWKYTSEANLDPTFDGDGIVVHGEAAGGGGNAPHDIANDIMLNHSGNIFITGKSRNNADDYDMVIWKYE